VAYRARDRAGWCLARAVRQAVREGPRATTLRRPAVILLAVVFDLAAGEPPARWHPVAWLGRAFHWAERRAPGRSVADGAAALALVTAGAFAVTRWFAAITRRLGWAGLVLEALALKPAFAVRRLVEATDGVEARAPGGRPRGRAAPRVGAIVSGDGDLGAEIHVRASSRGGGPRRQHQCAHLAPAV
jgi:adenosylcobinamide-phosphate synthase